jgi:hypothetical protein
MGDFAWWLLLAVGVLIGDGIVFWVGYRWHRHEDGAGERGRVDPDAIRRDIDRFNAALNAIRLCLAGVEEQVGRISQEGAPRPAESGLQADALRIAQRLAGQGASPGELSRTCGISPGEADLITRLTSGTRRRNGGEDRRPTPVGTGSGDPARGTTALGAEAGRRTPA